MRNLNNFNMTLEECRLVFDTLDNLVIIDGEGKIKYLSPGMYFMIEAYNKKPVPHDVVGKHIHDVHYVSKITQAIEKGEEIGTAFYFSSNVTNVARIAPLKKDGAVVGAIDYDLFTDGNILRDFLDEVNDYRSSGATVQRNIYEKAPGKKNTIPESYKNFDMTLEECKLVFDTMRNLVVIDANRCIKYLAPTMYDIIEKATGTPVPDDVVGLNIDKLHHTSKVQNVVETGRPIKTAIYNYDGKIYVSRIEPLIRDGEIVGAIDYDIFSSNEELNEFLHTVEEYNEIGRLNFENTFESMYDSSKRLSNTKYTINNILGNSDAMKRLRGSISDISESNATVLITGETGTGKELVANAIHNLSLRADHPIIAVNCAAIPSTLFESELFGYEEGAFTGAGKDGKPGFFDAADKGTLFLDEIDQLPYHVQPKLLRAIQEKEIVPVGGKAKPIDIRILTATNKDLLKLVEEGEFREDLYYRLNVVEILIPPLRHRREDIPLLAQSYLQYLNRQLMKNVRDLSDGVMKAFLSYDWPGNVRELFNVMERSVVACRGDVLQLEDLGSFAANVSAAPLPLALDSDAPLEYVRNQAEAAAIRQVLEVTGGNKAKAAKMLKISRTALYDKIKKLNIE